LETSNSTAWLPCCGSRGFRQQKIGRKLHQPVLVARRFRDIRDDFVGRQTGIDCEISLAGDQLVRPCRSESLAVLHVAALGNLDAQQSRRQQCGKNDGQNP